MTDRDHAASRNPRPATRRRWAALLFAGALALAGSSTGQAAPGHDPRVAPLTARVHGHTYGEWSAAWWQWAFAIPAAQNPILDETGADCARGQSGHVWFLAGTFGGAVERTCDVPAGTHLFFPVANVVWVQFFTDPPFSIPELRELLTFLSGDATLTAEIDGVPVRSPTSYRVQSSVFTPSMPDDNIYGVGEEQCGRGADGNFECHPSLDDGYYLMLHPLPPGEHTIRFTGSLPNIGFDTDVTYRLHVSGD